MLVCCLAIVSPGQADIVSDAVLGGKASLNFDLRYEDVEQDNALKDAQVLQLRTLIGYETAAIHGFSVKVEIEDSRNIAGVDDYSVPVTGFRTGQFSVIADPEHTELDQGYLQYKRDNVTVKLGRQIITHDGHRFIGHVGWRHDRQTFDAATVSWQPVEDVTLSYSYIGQRNGIFAEDADADSSDQLLHVAWQSAFGTLSLYDYDLELDDVASNGLKTTGIRFTGNRQPIAGNPVKLTYTAEFASQDSDSATVDYDAEYRAVELGAVINGFSMTVGQEQLGSDSGLYGFSTPLATLHKFNGWADQFLRTPAIGLEDSYVTIAAPVLGGKFGITWHDYSSDEKTASGADDLGEEINAVFKRKFAKHYTAGFKYATYTTGSATANVDTDKFWVWIGASFM